MSSDKSTKLSSLQELLGDIEDELENELTSSMPKEDQILVDISRRLLRLERDMTMPGSATSETSRIERITKFIEEEDF